MDDRIARDVAEARHGHSAAPGIPSRGEKIPRHRIFVRIGEAMGGLALIGCGVLFAMEGGVVNLVIAALWIIAGIGIARRAV